MNDEDAFVAKFDAIGNCLWAKTIGGTGREYGSVIAVDKDGNVFVTGYFDSPGFIIGTDNLVNSGSYDVYWTKIQAGTTDIQSFSDHSGLTVYPNPFSQTVWFSSEIEFTQAHLVIYNSVGDIVVTVNDIYGQQFEFERNALANGIYFYELIQQDTKISGKLVIQ